MTDPPAEAPPAVMEPDPGDVRVGGGLPLRSYPNWDEARQVFVFHAGERDSGSSYDDVNIEPPTDPPSASRRLGAAVLRLLRRAR